MISNNIIYSSIVVIWDPWVLICHHSVLPQMALSGGESKSTGFKWQQCPQNKHYFYIKRVLSGGTRHWLKTFFELIVTATTFSDGCKEYQKFCVLNYCVLNSFTESELDHPSRYLPAQSQQLKHQNNVPNLFQVNNKDTGVKNGVIDVVLVSIVNFEQVSHIVLLFQLLALKLSHTGWDRYSVNFQKFPDLFLRKTTTRVHGLSSS